MDHLTVGDLVAHRAIVTVHRDTSITEACMLMAAEDVSALAVVDETGLCGLVSERDVVRRGDACGTPSQLVSVAHIMTREVPVLPADAAFEDALHLIVAHHVDHIVVQDSQRCRWALLSMRDVLEVQNAPDAPSKAA